MNGVSEGLIALKRHKRLFTAQQYRSLKGQMLSGNVQEAKAAMDRVGYQVSKGQNTINTK